MYSGIIQKDINVSATKASSNGRTIIVKGASPWVSNNYTTYASGNIKNIDTSAPGQAIITFVDNITNTSTLFYDCPNLTYIDLSNFDTSIITDMTFMFNGDSNLTTVNGIIDMKSVINEQYDFMFYGCPKVTGLKFKNPAYAQYGFEKTTGLSSSQYTIVS